MTKARSNATAPAAKGELVIGTGTDTSGVLSVGNNGETLVADSSASAGLRWQGSYEAGKNKIINGDFGIWQRGTSITPASGYGYTADRWRTYSWGSSTSTVSRQTFTAGTAPVAGYEGQYFLRVSSTNTNTFVGQPIEDVRTLAGQTVTLSFWAKAASAISGTATVAFDQNFGSGGSATVNTPIGSNLSYTTSWTRYSYTGTLPSISGKTIGTGSFLDLTISLGQINNAFDIWGVQVEAGSVATAFQTATGTLAGELAACQRYYYRQAPSGLYANYGFGDADATGQCVFQMQLPVTMRVAPTTIDTSAMNTFYWQSGNSNGNTPTTITINANQTTTNLAAISVAKTTAFTVGSGYRLTAYNTANSYIGLGAEL